MYKHSSPPTGYPTRMTPRLRQLQSLDALVTSLPSTWLAELDDAPPIKHVRVQEVTLRTKDCAALKAYAEDYASRVALAHAYHERRPVRLVVDSDVCLYGAVKVTNVELT